MRLLKKRALTQSEDDALKKNGGGGFISCGLYGSELSPSPNAPHHPNGYIWDTLGYYGCQWKLMVYLGLTMGSY